MQDEFLAFQNQHQLCTLTHKLHCPHQVRTHYIQSETRQMVSSSISQLQPTANT